MELQGPEAWQVRGRLLGGAALDSVHGAVATKMAQKLSDFNRRFMDRFLGFHGEALG